MAGFDDVANLVFLVYKKIRFINFFYLLVIIELQAVLWFGVEILPVDSFS